MKLNECVLYCVDPNQLRVEIDEHRLYCNFDIFVDNKLKVSLIGNHEDYEDLYINLNYFYPYNISDDDIDDFIIYDKRNKMLELLNH